MEGVIQRAHVLPAASLDALVGEGLDLNRLGACRGGPRTGLLHVACGLGDRATVLALIERGASLLLRDGANERGLLPHQYAAHFGRLVLLKELLARFPGVREADKALGSLAPTALHAAATRGHALAGGGARG